MAVLFCFLPIIIAIIINKKAYKIKISHQLLACLFGLIAILPIELIQYYLPDFPSLKANPVFYSFVKSLLVYGFVEESFKTIFLLPLPHKNYTLQNFLLLSFVLGLALGTFESAVYFLDHLQIANAKGASLIYSQIFTRIFTTDIIHMICTGLSGLFIFTAHQKQPKVSPLILAILLHGIYDFFAGFQNYLHWFSIIVIFLALIECRIKYTNLNQEN